eukprot:969701_1
MTAIINDYMHCLDIHDDNVAFEYIIEHLGQCDVSKCHKFRRNYRDRRVHSEQKDIDEHTRARRQQTINDDVYVQVMDKMHCYFYHSRTRSNDSDEREQKSQNHMDKFNQIGIQHLRPNGTAKFYEYGHKFVYCEHEGCAILPLGDCDVDGGTVYEIYSKYNCLKEEVTQNEMCPLIMPLWDAEFTKARYHFNSYHARKLSRNRLEWILCQMIYCNYTYYQFEFAKTYRENAEDHVHFYHFG